MLNAARCPGSYTKHMWYIVRLDSSRVATLDKVRSATLVSSNDPTRVKSNYIPVKTTILRKIERCPGFTIASSPPSAGSKIVADEWNAISRVFKRLVSSMRPRYEAVVAAFGGSSRY